MFFSDLIICISTPISVFVYHWFLDISELCNKVYYGWTATIHQYGGRAAVIAHSKVIFGGSKASEVCSLCLVWRFTQFNYLDWSFLASCSLNDNCRRYSWRMLLCSNSVSEVELQTHRKQASLLRKVSISFKEECLWQEPVEVFCIKQPTASLNSPKHVFRLLVKCYLKRDI